MASSRSVVVVAVFVLASLAGCTGGNDTAPDAGMSGPPAGWTCDPRGYGDGVVCHCNCGVPDPDCASGDHIVSGCVNNEVCTPSGTCTNCGNGQVDSGEACDAALAATAECAPMGYQPGQVPCNSSCQWAYDQCAPLVTCGNGQLDPVELCDGSQIQSGLDCTDYNRTSGTLKCGSSCQIDSSGCYTCGDGKVEGPEGCDDSGTTNGNGCSSSCAPESGWSCSGSPSFCTPVCGDGMRVGSEACDDGNANSNDGCSASCQVEQDCSCSGSPSVCSCAVVQLVTTTTERIDTGSLALDGNGQPHATWYYGINYTDPVTNHSMAHAYAMYASRPSTSWTTSLLEQWDQIQAGETPESFVLAYDGGALHQYYHRYYTTGGTFAEATKSGSNWSMAYGTQYYNYDVIRGGGNWHALVAGSGFGDYRYYVGSPSGWTTNEPLVNMNTQYPMRLAYASNGDVYLTTITPASGHTSYNLKLSKRVGPSNWQTMYDVATTGTCVYPVSHEPLALANGEVITFEDGFGTSNQRWLKAHRWNGSSWVVENVADLSWLPYTSCMSSSASWSTQRMVTAADQLGRPHILFASMPQTNSLTFEDHYRDSTGWHVRTFPMSKGTPLDMIIDAQGTTHILAMAPSSTPSTTRIVYIRISASAWN
ncbi:MAG TPA: DUF4215 domain-containing protein [Kofleriaceae bacterium]|nr:DUF4215 domain-containing protein [Kofleriaceae bacterium]